LGRNRGDGLNRKMGADASNRLIEVKKEGENTEDTGKECRGENRFQILW